MFCVTEVGFPSVILNILPLWFIQVGGGGFVCNY